MKLKLNVLDWVVIGVLALLILFLGYQLIFAEQPIFNAPEEQMMVYQIEFRRRTPEFRDAITMRTEGDIVYVSAHDRDEAEVLEVIAWPAQVIELDRINNAYITSIVPNHYDILLTVRSNVVVTDREFRNGSTSIRIGAPTVVRGLGFAAEGVIIDMWVYGEYRDFELIEDWEDYEEDIPYEEENDENGEGGDE